MAAKVSIVTMIDESQLLPTCTCISPCQYTVADLSLTIEVQRRHCLPAVALARGEVDGGAPGSWSSGVG